MSRWAVVTFGRGVEPGAATPEVVAQLRKCGLALAGFFQRPATDPNTQELVRLGLDGCTPVGSKGAPSDPNQSCAFSFRPPAFDEGLAWLKHDAKGADVLVVGPIGRLELEGRGHAAALRWALGFPGHSVVVVFTRAERLGPVLDRFCPTGEPVAYLEVSAAGDGALDFAGRVAAAVPRVDRSRE